MNHVTSGVLLFATFGCTTQKDVRDVHDLVGEEVTVVTRHGSTTATVERTNGRIAYVADGAPIASSDVVSITQTSHVQGAAMGLVIGFGAGFVIGAGSNLAHKDTCEENPSCWDFGPTIAGVGMGLLGGAVGLLVGAVGGRNEVYDLRTSSVKIGGPSGSTAGLTITF